MSPRGLTLALASRVQQAMDAGEHPDVEVSALLRELASLRGQNKTLQLRHLRQQGGAPESLEAPRRGILVRLRFACELGGAGSHTMELSHGGAVWQMRGRANSNPIHGSHIQAKSHTVPVPGQAGAGAGVEDFPWYEEGHPWIAQRVPPSQNPVFPPLPNLVLGGGSAVPMVAWHVG